MLGREIEELFKKKEIRYIASDEEVDITEYSDVNDYLRGHEVEWIVNCAAYTDVDGAEKEKEKAFKVNAEGAGNLAKLAKVRNLKMLHISTDYVFDGTKDGEYLETDPANPRNIYGMSKLAGEKNIMRNLEKHIIFRTSWLYGAYGKNFVNTIVSFLEEKRSIEIISDQKGSPTNTKDLAQFIYTVINSGTGNYGIYNYTNTGNTTWFGFASEIYSISKRIGLINKEVQLIPVSTSQSVRLAHRPANSVLSKEKIIKTFGICVSDWKISLERYLMELSNERN